MKQKIGFSLVYRDMWQSSGKYVPTVDQLKEVAPAIIDMGCFDRVETNGGAFEQVNLLFGENPNKAVREWTAPFQKAGIIFAPGKAVNAGGVATSGLEMTQNAMHISWSPAEVDEKLHAIMSDIHDACVKYGTQPDGYINYVKGANIAGFMKVAQAMLEQGII